MKPFAYVDAFRLAPEVVESTCAPDEVPRVLFLSNEYYQGNPSLGPTSSWEVTWRKSIEAYFGERSHFFSPDVFGTDKHDASDAALMALAEEVQPDLIVGIFHKGLNWTREFVSRGALTQLSREGQTPIVAIWGDTQIPDQRDAVKSMKGLVDLNVCTATAAAAWRLSREVPVLYSWVPLLDPIVEPCRCGAQIGYAGSVKLSRGHYIRALERAGLQVHYGGGEGRASLPRESFLRILTHPVSLSFASSTFEPVVNARTFEVLRQGSMLLEQWGPETARIFNPYSDYVPWFDTRDLLSKVGWTAEYPEAAAGIAARGAQRARSLTNNRLWDIVLGCLQGEGDMLSGAPGVDWSQYGGPRMRMRQLQERLLTSRGSERFLTPAQRAIGSYGRVRSLARRVRQIAEPGSSRVP